MKPENNITKVKILNWLSEIPDPEIPVISILDLGIVRNLQISDNFEEVMIKITPTYSGCPAMDIISMQIRMALMSRGIKKVTIDYQLSPAWTTDWIPEEAKQKMLAYGIAPPVRRANESIDLFDEDIITCPHCGSKNTSLMSQFGATSCKALYRCHSCKEPFEHFKCH